MQRLGCVTCGLVYAHPMPGPEQLAAFNATYYNSAHGVSPDSPSIQQYHSGINRLRLAHALRYCHEVGLKPSNVLELGPGHGMFARHLITQQPGTRFWAVESDQTCHPTLVATVVSAPERLPASMPAVDLAVASHVLEHVANPKDFVSFMLKRLRPGGVLFLEVPCRDHEHKPWDEPHLLFFDKPAMSRLLLDLGARHLELSYHGIPLDILTSPTHRITGRLKRLAGRLGIRGQASVGKPPELFRNPTLAEEWKAVEPLRAHLTSTAPAWWLRAIALAP
jgi:SAM-dependent methyltransferase